MRLSALVYLYARRVRTRPVQELLAGVGIALGVALMFAVQIADNSITGSSREITKSIAGPATLQLSARGASGFNEGLLERVQRLRGVVRAAALLDLPATIRGPHSTGVPVQLASADPDLALLDGLAAKVSLKASTEPGLMLPTAVAQALGITTTVGHVLEGPRPSVVLDVRGRAISVRVTAVLGKETVGALSGAMAVFAPLWLIQHLAVLPGRVTRVLVQSAPGRETLVHGELERLAGGRLTVAGADQEIRLLAQALRPNAQATRFFVVISGLVGLLLAFNAMLLTTPERRRMIADLRIQGVRRWQLVQMLLFQALCLGVASSLVGLALGDVLARGAFQESPDYLAVAFPLGSQTVVGTAPLVVSLAAGVLATCIAAAPPLLDLRRSRAVDAVYGEEGEPGHALDMRARTILLACGIALATCTSGLLLLEPGAAIVATVGLAVALLLAIPAIFACAVWGVERFAARTSRLNMLLIASRALRATTVRSLALAATGAIAVFGSVVAEGAHQDLLSGLYNDYANYVGTADLWVTNHSDDLATMSFPSSQLAERIQRLAGVAAVRTYQGGYLDIGGRRVWVIARSPATRAPVPASQIIHGSLMVADARLRQGGWITIAQQIASAYGIGPGDSLTLPTPSGPATFRVAATTTNLGWSSGAIMMNDVDYHRDWATSDPSALEIDIRPDSAPGAVAAEIRRLLGPRTALQVQTSAQRAATADELARQGLQRLTQISRLLIAVAALAMAAAMGAAIWQRRASLASLRIQSFQPSQLRRVMIDETALVLGVGCLTGALAGVYGHILGDRYLRTSTGFPVSLTLQAPQTIEVVLLVLAVALSALVGPGYIASRTPPAFAIKAQ